MSTVQSLYPVVMTDDLDAVHRFYADLLGLDDTFVADWYVSLRAPQDERVQLAFVDRRHPSVPGGFAEPPRGVLVTVEVADVDRVHERAASAGLPMHVPLRTEAWGQRHFITEDPGGLLVDVVTVTPVDAAYGAAYVDPAAAAAVGA